MRDIERELRDLGTRARDDDAPLPISRDALRRIRLRRIGTVAMSILAVAGLALGGTYAAGVVIATDPNPVVPAEQGVTPDEGPRCGPPVDFAPTYLPKGWIEDLQVGSGGGGEWHGIVGHYGNDAAAGTTEKADGGFAELIAAKERPFPQGNREKIHVLDEPAFLGDIHEGYSVEFSQHGCDYFLLGYGIDRDELGRFAQGLALLGNIQVPAEPPEDENFAAIWPEDTADQAREACSRRPQGADYWRREATTTAVEFGRRVLDWDDAIAIVRERSRYGWTIELRKSSSDAGGGAMGPAIIVFTHEPIDRCWSVGSVSRLPDRRPTGLGVGVRGRSVDIGFDPLGARSATVEVGYAGRLSTQIWQPGDRPVHFELDFEPDTTGHFLILMRDATGDVFSAAGGPLPAGDFVAG